MNTSCIQFKPCIVEQSLEAERFGLATLPSSVIAGDCARSGNVGAAIKKLPRSRCCQIVRPGPYFPSRNSGYRAVQFTQKLIQHSQQSSTGNLEFVE